MKALMMSESDNVAVVLHEIDVNQKIAIYCNNELKDTLSAKTKIPRFHKVAVKDVGQHEKIIKYNEIIGKTTIAVARGEHLHTHNLISIRGSMPTA